MHKISIAKPGYELSWVLDLNIHIRPPFVKFKSVPIKNIYINKGDHPVYFEVSYMPCRGVIRKDMKNMNDY